jgi:hypothetical protein
MVSSDLNMNQYIAMQAYAKSTRGKARCLTDNSYFIFLCMWVYKLHIYLFILTFCIL